MAKDNLVAISNEKYHIHIVDDEETNRMVLNKMLQSNYDVTESENGRDCIKFVTENRPDLILLDIMMPGMSGFKTCAEIKGSEFSSDIPIIFVTAIDDRSYILEAFRNGGVDYIIKPFKDSEVKSRISSALNMVNLERDKNNLLRINQVILNKIKDVLEGLPILKNVDGIKSDLASSSSTMLDFFDQIRLNIANGNSSDALLALDDAEITLQFSDRASQQVNELAKVINQIHQIMTKNAGEEEVEFSESLNKASSDSVLSKKNDQAEVDDLLDSLGI